MGRDQLPQFCRVTKTIDILLTTKSSGVSGIHLNNLGWIKD